MEQKLYYLETLDVLENNSGSCEFKLPQDLLDLMGAGWRIVQISSYGYCTHRGNPQESCVLLLQRERVD